MTEDTKNTIINLPNMITIFRIVLVPVLFLLLFFYYLNILSGRPQLYAKALINRIRVSKRSIKENDLDLLTHKIDDFHTT